MKKIKVKFSGMGGNFDPQNNFIINILRVHFDVELSDEPEYLIYSVNSTDYLNYSCIRIFYTAENLVPDFNICDYAIGFHYLNFGDRYIRYPLYLVDGFIAYKNDDYASDLKRALCKHENAEKTLIGKTEFCSFVYSNAEAAKCREAFFAALSQYKTVNSGGRFKNNVGGPVESKLEFQLKHKFAIAFENTSTSGYTTEKIVHAFSSNTVPIYWGNPDIEKEFNGDAFVNCHRYGLTQIGEASVINRIVDEIIRLDKDDEAYLQMLKTPALAVQNNVDLQKKALENFLVHIFEQNKRDAYRRNRFYWGERYERKQRIGNRFYICLRKFIPLRDAVRRMFTGLNK